MHAPFFIYPTDFEAVAKAYPLNIVSVLTPYNNHIWAMHTVPYILIMKTVNYHNRVLNEHSTCRHVHIMIAINHNVDTS